MNRRTTAVLCLLALTVACGSPAQRAANRLIEQARLDDPDVSATYADNKDLIESTEAVPIWLDVLENDESPKVKRWAAVILGNIGDERALPALAAALGNNSRDVREAARDAIRQFSDEQATNAFVTAIQSGDRDAQAIALAQISRLRAASAVPAVIEVAKANDPVVSETACTTLGDIGTPEAANALAALATDTTQAPKVRRHALVNLTRIEGAGDQVAEVIKTLEQQGDDTAKDLLTVARQAR